MKISENIKRLRLEKNLTQQEVADDLFVTRQCISRWESGKTIPDIESMEKLSVVFGCTINDIFEEKTLQELAIKNTVIQKSQKKHVLILSIASIILLIGLVTSVLFLNDRLQARTLNIKHQSMAIINEIRPDTSEYVVSLEESPDIFYTLILKDIQGIYFNNDLDPISRDNLGVFDLIYIEYMDNIMDSNVTKLILVDKPKTDSLLGVAYITNGIDYQTVEALMADINLAVKGIRYYTHNYGDSDSYTHNIGFSEASRTPLYKTYNDYYIGKHIGIDMTIYFDEDKLEHEPRVALIYESGLYYQNLNLGLSFTGEIDIQEEDPYFYHSTSFTYTLNIEELNAFEYFIVYEYDKNNLLIKETTIEDWQDMFNFSVDSSAVYSYVKVYSETMSFNTPTLTFTTHKLNVGEKLDINLHDGEGLVWKDYFYYN